jgi:hypothetical protein
MIRRKLMKKPKVRKELCDLYMKIMKKIRADKLNRNKIK